MEDSGSGGTGSGGLRTIATWAGAAMMEETLTLAEAIAVLRDDAEAKMGDTPGTDAVPLSAAAVVWAVV